MHSSVLTWVGEVVDHYDLAAKDTLEVGSYNVNGTVRHLFHGPYTGVDLKAGPSVDIVCDAHDLSEEFYGGPGFDVVISTEMLEHDSEPWTSLQQMRRVANKGAALIVTARGYDHRGCFPLHEYPDDLWRFSINGMKALLEWAGWAVVYTQLDPDAPGVFAVAYNRPDQ